MGGIEAGKAVGKVALGLQPLAGQRGHSLAAVQIVGVGTVGVGVEAGGHGLGNLCQLRFTHPQHQERFARLSSIGHEVGEHRRERPLPQWRQVGIVPVGLEAKQQVGAVLSQLRVVEKAPTHQVQETQVAVAAGRCKRVALHQRLVGHGERSKGNGHGWVMVGWGLSVRWPACGILFAFKRTLRARAA